MAQHIGSSSQFEETVKNQSSEKVILADFYADWCSPCRKIAPVVEELASTYQHCMTVVKVNVDSHEELSDKYEVRQMPTFVFIKDNEEVDRFIGSSEDTLRERVKRNC
ncbi:hypothetical protein FDP41_012695 [Naegleria fowleri]|uniref:Thioredoxin n=1 Tax=Naegleria fowleri TaxID=5763 RepID=A0A6A5BUL7_NAEFO|nr:uncharacterized protein FDP41_012695 [Naegleria fowleri]KAF0980907.1 hypothetical protein FDP41_012695 [Naegleria fowleri]CAG4716608.1 unnamed protein product [Naegleria fowleri]